MRHIPFRNPVELLLIVLALSLTVRVAVADVVAVVSVKNPVTTLSKSQLVDIFLGKTSRFPDGSKAEPIDLAESSAERGEFYLKFTGKSPAQMKAYWSKIIFTGRGQPHRKVENSTELKKQLVENPNAISYIEEAQVDDSVKVVLIR